MLAQVQFNLNVPPHNLKNIQNENPSSCIYIEKVPEFSRTWSQKLCC